MSDRWQGLSDRWRGLSDRWRGLSDRCAELPARRSKAEHVAAARRVQQQLRATTSGEAPPAPRRPCAHPSTPLRGPSAAALQAAMMSAYLAGFSRLTVRSTTDTCGWKTGRFESKKDKTIGREILGGLLQVDGQVDHRHLLRRSVEPNVSARRGREGGWPASAHPRLLRSLEQTCDRAPARPPHARGPQGFADSGTANQSGRRAHSHPGWGRGRPCR